MNIDRQLWVLGALAIAIGAFGAGCKGGGSGGGGSTKSGGGTSSTTTAAAAVSQIMSLISSQGLVRSGVISPSGTLANYTVSCPEGGGPINVNGSGASFTQSGDSFSFSGSVIATFNNCVVQGITFGGGWTETFNFTDTFAPSGCVTGGGGCTSFTMNGSVAVPNSTISLTGAGVNFPSCNLNFSETLSNISVNLQTGGITGSLTYSGTICGTSVSGSCSFSGSSLTCS